MSFYSEAQELVVVDDGSNVHDHMPHIIEMDGPGLGMPVNLPPMDGVEVLGPEGSAIEIVEPEVVNIFVSDLPGAPSGTTDPEVEENLEVLEEDSKDKDDADDNNDARKSKKKEKWDWESKGAKGFISWVKERVSDVPKHSGYDSAGLERAMSYLEKLDAEISKAMRLDVDGELDADKIESVRSQIEDGISRLTDRLDKVKEKKKTKRKKKAEEESNSVLIKEGQKITGVQGVYVTVPLLISGIARVCINSAVSAGHDISKVYHEQADKYKLSSREKSEVKWLLYDMGYPIRGDRGFMYDDDVEVDTTSSDNFDYMANYRG